VCSSEQERETAAAAALAELNALRAELVGGGENTHTHPEQVRCRSLPSDVGAQASRHRTRMLTFSPAASPLAPPRLAAAGVRLA
jgi:hypothetical protein